MNRNVSTKINVSLSNHVLISIFSYRCPSLKLWVFQTSIRPTNYGASPDGISEAFLVEVNTRAENSEAPLGKITGSHIIQANFQMSCKSCIFAILSP